MTTQTEALTLALTKLKNIEHPDCTDEIMAIEQALAQPERHELQADGKHPAPCARFCEANAFQIEIRRLKAQLAQPEQEPVAHTAVFHCPNCEYPHRQVTRITGVAQPPWLPQRKEQEPVAEVVGVSMLGVNSPTGKHINALVDLPIGAKLYTTPPQRTWVGLTNDEINEFAAGCHLSKSVQSAIYEAEAKLKEKNT